MGCGRAGNRFAPQIFKALLPTLHFYRFLHQQVTSEMIDVVADYTAHFVSKDERIREASQRLWRLTDGKAMAIAFQQCDQSRHMAGQEVEVVQNDAQTAVASAGEETGNHVSLCATIEVKTLEVPIENADTPVCRSENPIDRLVKCSASVEVTLQAFRHSGGDLGNDAILGQGASRCNSWWRTYNCASRI